MATTGTYTFQPGLGEIILGAFARIQIRRTEITAEHMQNARMEANLLQAGWSNLGPLLWTVDLVTVDLVSGTKTYNVEANTVMMLDVYLGLLDDNGFETDRIITPLSRTEYASMPNKDLEGAPTSFWFDRLIAPTFTLWPVPSDDTGGPYVLKYYRYTQIQDAASQNGGQPQIPYLWVDAYVAGLAWRLARIYAPALEAQRMTDAKAAFDIAQQQGVENVPLYLAPSLISYYRS